MTRSVRRVITGYTPLHYACYYTYSDIVIALMLADADETMANMYRETPVQLAERKGHKELLRLLNRASLWEMMLNHPKKLNKLSAGFLVSLTIKWKKRKSKRKYWYLLSAVTHFALIISKSIQVNQLKHKHYVTN